MERQWAYFTREHEDIRILIDLGLKNKMNNSLYPNILTLFINVYHIAENKNEAERIQNILQDIQNKLDREIFDINEGIFIGRIESQTRNEFIYYIRNTSACREIIERTIKEYPSLRYTIAVREDKNGEFYQYLYPNMEEAQLSRNQQTLHYLSANGYKIATKQNVFHYFRFPTKSSLEELKELIKSQGYHIEDIKEDPNDFINKHLLIISKWTVVNEESINEATYYFIKLCKQYAGTYDGWGVEPKERVMKKFEYFTKNLKVISLFSCFVIVCSLLGLYLFDGNPSKIEKLLGTNRKVEVKVQKPLEINKPVPFLKLKNDDGEVIQMGNTGRPMVLNFCDVIFEPCINDYLQMLDAADQFHDQMDFFTVRLEKNSTDLLIQHPPTYPFLYDAKGDAYHQYHALPFPITYILNSKGVVVDVVGLGDSVTLEKIKSIIEKIQ